MDKECREELRELMAQFLFDVVGVADKYNLDRDELAQYAAKLLVTAASVSTFKAYELDTAVVLSSAEEVTENV